MDANRTLRSVGAEISVNETSAHLISLRGAQSPWSSTTAWVALAGARYSSETSVHPCESIALSVGCSASAPPAYPTKYPLGAGTLIGTCLPLESLHRIRTTAL